MTRLQKPLGVLRALLLSRTPCNIASLPLASVAAGLQAGRHFTTSAGLSEKHVLPPPAATYVDIADEFYLRQRSQIPLGSVVPHPAVGVYIAPSAVVVGLVRLLDRVSAVLAAWTASFGACSLHHCCLAVPVSFDKQCTSRIPIFSDIPASAVPQVSVWNNVVIRGDLNAIVVGSASNIQDRTVIHAAR